MKKIDWKDIAIRAGKTFLQAFIGAIAIDITSMPQDTGILKDMLLAAVAAGISAVMNFTIKMLDDEYL